MPRAGSALTLQSQSFDTVQRERKEHFSALCIGISVDSNAAPRLPSSRSIFLPFAAYAS
jgi:hypothetical protein